MHRHGGGDGEDVSEALNALGLRWRAPRADDVLLAIDDTDDPASAGTGFRARELAMHLAAAGLARPLAVTHHRLLVDPGIAYTSHNRSACLLLDGLCSPAAVFDFGCYYLRDAAAAGANAGLVLLRRCEVDASLQAWGRRAKTGVLDQGAARALAADLGPSCAELGGNGAGLIGAMAAAGLHAGGNDGHLLWLHGLGELAHRRLPAAELAERTGVAIKTLDGTPVAAAGVLIELGDRPRAVLRGHRPVLLVEADRDSPQPAWRSVGREIVMQF